MTDTDCLHWLSPKPPAPRRTRVMGIVNVTPDSFSDGGEFNTLSTAVHHARAMIQDGADILDIGGESSRPGAQQVDLNTELQRVIPLIETLRKESETPISLDTCKAEVARQGLIAGATIINDISALHADKDMASVIANANAGLCLMHMQGTPGNMQNNPAYQDVEQDVCSFLKHRLDFAVQSGIAREQILLDPGIGFGKTLQHNLSLLTGAAVHALEQPLLLGVSRKSMLGQLSGETDPKQRMTESLAALAPFLQHATQHGTCTVIRVHDVKASIQFLAVLDALQEHSNRREYTHAI